MTRSRILALSSLGATALLAVGVLSGCAAPAPEAAAPTEAGDQLEGTVTVFAAASLTETFESLATEFEGEHPGVDVVFNFGGSSALATQITEGAPADVFAAANESTMQTVTDASLSVDPTIFASNTLEIAVPVGNPAGVTGLADFASPDLAIAICDVEVPCGAAADKLFTDAGVTAEPDTLEEDVKAVLTKVELGEADAGLVYVTDVIAAGDAVEGIEFAEADLALNLYPIATLADAPNPDAATAWVQFVLSDAGQAALADAGFGAAE
jgi:molybdate transport system substrate-binding protein